MKSCEPCNKKKKLEQAIDEYRKGKRGSLADGPVITNKQQAISINLSEDENIKCHCAK